MTWLFSHLCAVCLGAGAMWTASRIELAHREARAESRGMLANVIAHSPEDRLRHMEGSF